MELLDVVTIVETVGKTVLMSNGDKCSNGVMELDDTAKIMLWMTTKHAIYHGATSAPSSDGVTLRNIR